jgi:Fe-S-cluster containining protein
MARPPSETATAHAARFRPDAKCCTYMPTLWSFLAGGVLSDNSPEGAQGRATVERRIDRGLAVTPLGLRMTSTYEVLYRSKLDTFGRNAAFRCPHYIDERGGLCGVWRHRNSTCATYFCKLERGAVGKEFWTRLRQLLATVEEGLAHWCLLELDVEVSVLQLLFPPAGAPAAREELDGGPDAAQRLPLWGPRWIGREREFYIECSRRVAGLAWDDVLRITGPSTTACSRLVERAYGALEPPPIPERARLGKMNLVSPADVDAPEDGVYYLSTYSASDMPKLPHELLGVLPLFDGHRRTRDVLDAISARSSLPMVPSDVRRLIDHGVLVPVVD